MGTRNKKKINVERVGNSGHPITTNPTPVRHVMFQDKIPYTTFSNGTVVQSTVNKDGVNEQILRKSNLNPAYKLEVKYDGVSTPDTLGLYRANHPSDLWAYDKIKPGTKEYKEAVEKFNSYGIPLATYGEAYDNLKEVERQVDGLQEGGEIPLNTAVSFLENLPYGRHNVDKHNKLVEMGKRFGNAIPGSVKPVPLPSKYQPAVPPVKMPMHQQDTSDIKPAPMPMYPGQSTDRMPMHKDNKFAIPQEMYQEGGNLPSDDQQQQLFIAIITDMAKTLGVEPSQELAEAVMAAFENNDDSQGLLTLFTKTKDKFMNETGLFREGGKMIAFIEKFGCGGKSPKKKTSKKQEGGEVELTRRQARDLSKLNKGYDNGDFRMAYQNAKNTLANNTDLSGRERRMAARRMVSGINDNAPTTPTLKPMDAQLNVASPALNPVQALGPSRPAPATSTPMGPIDRIQGRVNNAIDGYQRGTDRIIDGIQAGGNRVYDAVQDGVRRVNDGIQAGGNAIVDGMQNVSRRAGDWVQNAGNKVFDGIQSASNVFGIRPEFVDRAIDDVQAGVNRAYDNAQDFGARVVDGIQSGANRAYDAVQDGARRIGDGVQNVGNRIIDGGQRVRNAVIDGTQNFGNRVVDGVQAGAQRLGQGIQRAGQRISEWFR